MSKVTLFAILALMAIIGAQGQIVGGCAGTRYGCAPGEREAELERLNDLPYRTGKLPLNRVLEKRQLVGGCAGTQGGCSPGQREAELESYLDSVEPGFIGGCAGTQYGCAPGERLRELEDRVASLS